VLPLVLVLVMVVVLLVLVLLLVVVVMVVVLLVLLLVLLVLLVLLLLLLFCSKNFGAGQSTFFREARPLLIMLTMHAPGGETRSDAGLLLGRLLLPPALFNDARPPLIMLSISTGSPLLLLPPLLALVRFRASSERGFSELRPDEICARKPPPGGWLPLLLLLAAGIFLLQLFSSDC
jgi:hypothetical protein